MFSNVLPKVVADIPLGGGVLGSMQAGQNYDQTRLNNSILNAQSKYAPQQAYANALLTTQQANYTPYQYQMQALASPYLWAAAANNPALQNQLVNMLSKMPASASGQYNNLPAPPTHSGNSLLEMLVNKITGKPSQDQLSPSVNNQGIPVPQANNMLNQPGNMGEQPVNNINQPISNPNVPLATTPSSTPSAGTESSFLAQTGAGQSQAQAQATSNVQASTHQNQQLEEKSKAASDLVNLVRNAKNILKNEVTETTPVGSFMGNLNPSSVPAGLLGGLGMVNLPPAQKLNTLYGNISTAMGANSMFGKLAGPEISALQRYIPAINTDVDVQLQNLNRLEAKGMRDMELPSMSSALSSQSLNASPAEKSTLINLYNKNVPAYDENGNPNPPGLWKYWANKEAINAIREGDTNYRPDNFDKILKEAKENQNTTNTQPSSTATTESNSSNVEQPSLETHHAIPKGSILVRQRSSNKLGWVSPEFYANNPKDYKKV